MTLVRPKEQNEESLVNNSIPLIVSSIQKKDEKVLVLDDSHVATSKRKDSRFATAEVKSETEV